MVERHEALRTTFVSDGDEPRQQIHAGDSMGAAVVSTVVASEVEGRAQAEAARPFDLARGPLLRTTLLRLGDEDHVLLVTMHHIVSDGWSLGVLVREMMALYDAYVDGQPPTLAPLAVQYADFALWQRNWLPGEVLERAARLLARASRRRAAAGAADRPPATGGGESSRRDAMRSCCRRR